MKLNLEKWISVFDKLKTHFKYNFETGDIFWIETGKLAGTITENGYRRIRFENLWLPCHIVAWILHYNKIPSGEIDHINHDRLDNRICNLRDVHKRINQKNRKNPTSSNYYGVSKTKNNKWQVHVYKNDKLEYLGIYENEEEANNIVLKYEKGEINADDIQKMKDMNKRKIIDSLKKKRRENPYFGTTFNKSKKKWEAQLVVDKVHYYLGSFDDREEASKRVKQKEKELTNAKK